MFFERAFGLEDSKMTAAAENINPVMDTYVGLVNAVGEFRRRFGREVTITTLEATALYTNDTEAISWRGGPPWAERWIAGEIDEDGLVERIERTTEEVDPTA